jgi:putative addiction module killer protein
MRYHVRELLQEDGSSPYADWFNRLPADAAAKVTIAKLRVEQGNLSNVKWIHGIGEYRIDYGPGWRIYFAQDGADLIVLLGGGRKKGQQGDIVRAVELWRDYKRRKANERSKTAALARRRGKE